MNREIKISLVIEDGTGFVGDYRVQEGDRYCDGLCWDEMIGHVISLTAPMDRMSNTSGIYGMATEAQHKEKRAKYEAKRANGGEDK